MAISVRLSKATRPIGMRVPWLPIFLVSGPVCSYLVFAIFAVACSRENDVASENLLSRITSPEIEVDVREIPKLDRTKAVVPTEEIHFDTFGGVDRVIALNKVNETMIVRFRDRIPPIYNPKFHAGKTVDWMDEEDLVVGFAQGDIAVAYPIKILNWHEIVSHEVDDVPIVVTY